MYTDTDGKLLEPVEAQLTGGLPLFVQCWGGSEVASGSGGKMMPVLKV